MRVLFTILVLSTVTSYTVFAQDRAELEARISRVTTQIDSLTSIRSTLNSQLDALIREGLARREDAQGVKVILTGNNGLYVRGSFSPEKMIKDAIGVLTGKFDMSKAYFIAENGDEGFVLMSKMEFLEDPSEFVSVFGPDVPRMAIFDWKQLIKKWEIESGIGYFPLTIEKLTFSVNSADGVEPAIRIRNRTDKTIKYTTVDLGPFNSVGDPAPDRFNKAFRLRLVGPIEAQRRGSYDYDGDPVIYNGVVSCIEIRRVFVEYMDGTSYTMINDLKDARRASADYKVLGECAYSGR